MLVCKSSGYLAVILLDLSSAFDTIEQLLSLETLDFESFMFPVNLEVTLFLATMLGNPRA